MSRIIIVKKGKPIRLTKNFISTEFDCKCKYHDCTITKIDMEHVEKLQSVRDRTGGKPIILNSAYRCVRHNKDVGGATLSRHLVGDATDIVIPGLTISQIETLTSDFQGQGLYDTFVHVDSRPDPKTIWDFRSKK